MLTKKIKDIGISILFMLFIFGFIYFSIKYIHY